MTSSISKGVQISVETFYQDSYSNPYNNEFIFAYRIKIENKNPFHLKLIGRIWNIYDSNTEVRKVEGEGVVGLQPIIKTNEHFQYISSCNLKTEIGRMKGIYIMENLETKEKFNVIIPYFELIAPLKLN